MSSRFSVNDKRVYYEKDGQVIIDKNIADLTPEERTIARKQTTAMSRFFFFISVLMLVFGGTFLIKGDVSSNFLSVIYIFLIVGALLFGVAILIKRTNPF